MGYELNKLKQQYGVATPGMVSYTGPAAPTVPTEPTKLGKDATDEEKAAYNTAKANYDAYVKDPAAFNDMLRKYSLAQKEYNQYRDDYQSRLANTNMYSDPQFQTSSAADLFNRYATGFTPDQTALDYWNNKIRSQGLASTAQQFLNPTDVNAPRAGAMGADTDYANYKATGKIDYGTGTQSWGKPVQSPTYGAVPASMVAKSMEEKGDYYKRLRDLGYTDAEVRAATAKTMGKQTEENWMDLLNAAYPDYRSPLQKAYGNIGRAEIGTSVHQIDPTGYNYWLDQLISNKVKPENLTESVYNAANTWMPTATYDQSLVPQQFDWAYYVDKYPDLYKAGIDTLQEAQRHYALYGAGEGRTPYYGWTAPANTNTNTTNTSNTTSGGVTLIDPNAPADDTATVVPPRTPEYDWYWKSRMIAAKGGSVKSLAKKYAVGGGVNSDVNALDENARKMLAKYDIGMRWGMNPDESYGSHQMYESNPETKKFISEPYGDYVGVRVEQDKQGNAMYIPMYTGTLPEKKKESSEPVWGWGMNPDESYGFYRFKEEMPATKSESSDEPKWEWGENSDGSYGFYRYANGGGVRKFQTGGDEGVAEDPIEAVIRERSSAMGGQMPPMEPPAPVSPVTSSPAAQPVTPPPAATTPVSPAATDLMSMMQRYLSAESTYGPELAAARKRADAEGVAFQKMITDAMKPDSSAPDKSEMYFRLAAAFGAPTKTGSFSENLGMVGKELGEYAKDVRAAKKADKQLRLQLGIEAQKLKTQAARDELTTLRALAGEEMKDKRAILQEYIKTGMPQSEAGKAAMDAGLTKGTPEFNTFVNKYIDDKIRSGNLLKEAMVAIAAGNLQVAQSRETRAAESAAKLTPAEVKLKSEAETTIGGLDDSMASLKRAYSLNPNTFDGTLASIAQQKVLEQTNPKDPRVLATREQKNLLSKGAIDKLRASFGGNPTEGERAALLDLEGLDSKSKEERAQIMKNTYKLLQARRAREQKRLNDISAGLYRETTPAAGDLE